MGHSLTSQALYGDYDGHVASTQGLKTYCARYRESLSSRLQDLGPALGGQMWGWE